MLGFKAFRSAQIILSGIELMHMMRKGQFDFQGSSDPQDHCINWLDKTRVQTNNFDFNPLMRQNPIADAIFTVPTYGPKNDFTLKMTTMQSIHLLILQLKEYLAYHQSLFATVALSLRKNGLRQTQDGSAPFQERDADNCSFC